MIFAGLGLFLGLTGCSNIETFLEDNNVSLPFEFPWQSNDGSKSEVDGTQDNLMVETSASTEEKETLEAAVQESDEGKTKDLAKEESTKSEATDPPNSANSGSKTDKSNNVTENKTKNTTDNKTEIKTETKTNNQTNQNTEKNTTKENKNNNDDVKQGQSGDGFQSDWREGYENYYGYGQTEDWNRSGRQQNFVVQDQWLYYSSGSKIYKMPIGGKAADVQIIYDSKSEYDENLAPLRIAVVKDWVFFCRTYDGLYKIRTDGTKLQKLLDKEQMITDSYFDYDGLGYYALFDNECCYSACFHIIGDKIYYISKEGGKKNYSISYYDIDTNQTKYWTTVSENDRILAGFENQLIIYSKWKEENAIFIWNVDRCMAKTIVGFGSMPRLHGRDMIFELDIQEEYEYNFDYKTATINMDTWEINTQITNYPMSESDKIFKRLYWDLKNKIAYANIKGELSYLDDSIEGNQTWKRINGDSARVLIAGFDEYVYYSTYHPWFVQYRVRPDGTGYEEVEWMYP